MSDGANFHFTAGQPHPVPVPLPAGAPEMDEGAHVTPVPAPTARAPVDAPVATPAPADTLASAMANLPDHLNPAKIGALPPKQLNSPYAGQILDEKQAELQTKSARNKKAFAEQQAKREAAKNEMLQDAAELLGAFDAPAAGNDDLRAIRRRGARISMKFLEKQLPNALATLVSCMNDPSCSAQQLRAAMEVIRITSIDPTMLLAESVEVIGETVQEQLDCVTRLYSSGVISATEQTALLQGVKMKADILAASQAEELALLTAELKDRLSAEKAKSGRLQ